MASPDIEAALDLHVAWGLKVLDLKDQLFGKNIESLDEVEATRLNVAIQARSLKVWTLSTGLFFDDVDKGPEAFRQAFLNKIDAVLATAKILKPYQIRLLAARSAKRQDIPDGVAFLKSQHPWLIEYYREAIDKITSAGFKITLENEVHGCLLSKPQEVLDFFKAVDRPQLWKFTWDVQNLWQEGTFPSLQVYEQLKPLIGMLHLKGGRCESPSGPLTQASSLERASWPILPILKAVFADGRSPVVCLNPSHGAAGDEPCHRPEDYKKDLDYLRKNFPEIEDPLLNPQAL
jgi:hypothetical protein